MSDMPLKLTHHTVLGSTVIIQGESNGTDHICVLLGQLSTRPFGQIVSDLDRWKGKSIWLEHDDDGMTVNVRLMPKW